MAMTMPFDTLAFVRRLEDAGMERRQPEALASALREVAMPDLATKRDLADATTPLRRDLADATTALRTEITAVRTDLDKAVRDLTIRMGAMIGGSVGLVGGLLALLAHLRG